MTDDFAPPPTPEGTPSGTVTRGDFRSKAPARRRSGFPRWVAVLMAVGGLVILAGVAAQVTLTVRNSNLTPADPGTTGRLHSAQVVSGMCLESLGKSAGTVNVVACEDSHTAEVVSAYAFTTDEWPGDEAAATAVLNYCAVQLAPGGPLSPAASQRDWVAWVPSQGTWQHGDRKGLCIVTAEAPWTGGATTQPVTTTT